MPTGLRSLYKSTAKGGSVTSRLPVRAPISNIKWLARNSSTDFTKKIQNLLPKTLSSISAQRDIHDAVSNIPKKRQVRKKRTEHQEKMAKDGYFSVTAFGTAEEYDLEKLFVALKAQDLYEPKKFFSVDDSSENEPDVLYATAKYQVGSEPRGIYFFREGTVVMWNCSDMESSNILTFLRNFEEVSRHFHDPDATLPLPNTK